MGAIRIWITDALDDGKVAFVEERFQTGQLWVQAGVGIDFQDFVSGNSEPRSAAIVGVIGEWHDHVQAIVSASHLEHDETIQERLTRTVKGL